MFKSGRANKKAKSAVTVTDRLVRSMDRFYVGCDTPQACIHGSIVNVQNTDLQGSVACAMPGSNLKMRKSARIVNKRSRSTKDDYCHIADDSVSSAGVMNADRQERHPSAHSGDSQAEAFRSGDSQFEGE